MIYYYDASENFPSGEAFLADLSQMQLFVIPVTWRFIYQESSARMLELAYAQEHHIPVLPLMQEDGLDSDFNRVCGDIQYLSKHNSMKDATAIPYEEKLRKYLESVLVSDELAEQIRRAFDAYIFLSYRKKDRKYAQEIMHLIHENDFCRDIAIWYDEFLTPGENFNEAIVDAMEKSQLFALVVTPNLLESPNYVMTTEYPQAKKASKQILPIEALETDDEEMKKKYQGIPSKVSVGDKDGVAHLLRESLGMIARQEQNHDPKHLFFIGLAYLSGIDVEVDHQKAFALIEAAANQGLPEAYEKLVSMYNTGEGVERD
ncbi:MAG: toll/interleukin-1 receptor domain-containing protein, partial [Lachnospiraceae bacterium]|nr:toll/interleukin-1 receptor domain-containing protein [Lachnospiraceae bacterium]